MLYLSDMNLGMSTIQRILMVLYVLVKMHLNFHASLVWIPRIPRSNWVKITLIWNEHMKKNSERWSNVEIRFIYSIYSVVYLMISDHIIHV